MMVFYVWSCQSVSGGSADFGAANSLAKSENR
jgi:hypothetical protein